VNAADIACLWTESASAARNAHFNLQFTIRNGVFQASFYFLSHSPLYIHLNAAEQALRCIDTSRSLANSNNTHQTPGQDHTAIMPPQELKVVMEVAFPDPQVLHRDLERKYHDVGMDVDNLWRKLTKKQREKAVKQACVGSQPPKTRHDRTNPEFCALIPEYNVRDMSSQPNHFLNIFKFRALTALRDQLDNGADGAPGDRETIEKVVNGTINPNKQQAPDGAKVVFLDGKL